MTFTSSIFLCSDPHYVHSWVNTETMRGAIRSVSQYRAYPHDMDEYVFIIYQVGQMKKGETALTSTATPILQWLAIIMACSLVLQMLRRFTREQNVISHRLTSFSDSVAIFLGTALNRISNNRPERIFFICFSLFGLIFKTIYTGNLFVMYQMHSDSRMTTVNQLAERNWPIFTDQFTIIDKLCIGEPE